MGTTGLSGPLGIFLDMCSCFWDKFCTASPFYKVQVWMIQLKWNVALTRVFLIWYRNHGWSIWTLSEFSMSWTKFLTCGWKSKVSLHSPRGAAAPSSLTSSILRLVCSRFFYFLLMLIVHDKMHEAEYFSQYEQSALFYMINVNIIDSVYYWRAFWSII